MFSCHHIKERGLIICFLAAFLIGFCFYSHTQPQQKSLTEFSTENGLSTNSINDLVFDKQGFLWIASADGLQRFDGYHFQTFRQHDGDKKSLPRNYVGNLYDDEEDNLWIAFAGGLAVKPAGKFEFINLTSSLPPTAYKTAFNCVGETDKEVLILCPPSGIYAINKTSWQSRKIFALPNMKEESIEILYPALAKGDNTWMRTREDMKGEIFCLSADGIRAYKNERKLNLLYLIPESKDSLVIVTTDAVYKSSTIDPFKTLRLLQTDFNAGDFDNTLKLYPKKIGVGKYLLLGLKKEWIYDAALQAVAPFTYGNNFQEVFTRYLNVTAIDNHQNIWLGYNGVGGIKVINPSSQKFSLFQKADKNALVYSLFAADKIYAGIYLGDIEVYDKQGIFLQKIKLPEAYKIRSSTRAMALIDSETLIVKTTFAELYAINTKTCTVEILNHLLPSQKESTPLSDFEPTIQKLADGKVLISYHNNLLSLQKSNTSFALSTVFTLPIQERISSFYKEANGTTWIGTTTAIWRFANKQFYKLPLPSLYVKQITQHPDGKLWIATTDGIYVMAGDQLVKRIGSSEGLPNSFVYGVLFDENGKAWASTNRGLACIDKTWTVTGYSSKEGLQGEEFNTRGYSKGQDNKLYFAGVNGINFFIPEKLNSKGKASPTVLTQIEVNNTVYMPSVQPELIQTITLPYYQNNLRLSFSCMDFTAPQKNQYKFWLKGFQNDWSLPQTANTVQYILPPGEYELLVNGANYEGVWSDKPLRFYINILPPWYQTSLARVLFLLLVLSVFAIGIYFILRKKYRKKLRQLEIAQQVQKEKERISRDLHDNLGSQISWLSNTIHQLQTNDLAPQPFQKKIVQLEEGTGELMQTLRNTIWVLNTDKINAVDLFDKIISHAAKHIEMCPSMKLQSEENIATEATLNSTKALQVFRICQEAIHNTCKHAQAAVLKISGTLEKDHFTISLHDDGIGFNTSFISSAGHYGLQNMQQRAAENALSLMIDSSSENGTLVTISVPA